MGPQLTLETVAPVVIMMAALLAGFWLIVIRPAQARQRRHERLIAELKVGDKVVTVGGIYGTITRVGDKTIDLDVGAVTLRLDRRAIRRKQSQEDI